MKFLRASMQNQFSFKNLLTTVFKQENNSKQLYNRL